MQPQISRASAIQRAVQKPRTGLGQAHPAGQIPVQPGQQPQKQGGSQTPWSAAYEQTVGAANQTYNNSVAGLGTKATGIVQSYGIGQDPATNPYSQAAQLQRSYDNQRNATLNSAGNQLYSGAQENRVVGDRLAHDQAYDTLNRSYLGELGGVLSGVAEAGDTRNSAIAGAAWQKVGDAIKQPPESMPARHKRVQQAVKTGRHR